jgi:hypothetical protein
MKKYGILLSILAFLTALIQCAKENPAATASAGDRPTITGVLYGDNNAFAQNAAVQIRPKSTLADTSAILAKREEKFRSTTTDGSGRFSFEANLEPDVYVVEAKSGCSAALIDSVRIVKKYSNVELAAATLKPTGAIKGVVRLPQGGDPRSVYVLAFGIDRFDRAAADGGFIFSGLAQGVYTLRLISDIRDYGVLDRGDIEVFSAETTDVKQLSLPYRTVPVPLNLRAGYDTLTQWVTLRWNILDTSLVNGYYLYRRKIDENSAFAEILDSLQANDTVFVDTTAVQDLVYEYRIAAINKTGQEGMKSDGVKVTIASYFKVDTVFTEIDKYLDEGNLSEFVISPSGDFYFSCPLKREIQVFGPLMNEKYKFATGVWINHLGDFEDDRVYAMVLDQSRWMENILAFSAEGVLTDTLISIQYIGDFDINKGLLAVGFIPDSLKKGDSIALYSTGGMLKKSWSYDHGFACRDILIADANKIFCALPYQDASSGKVVAYDSLGNKILEMTIPKDYSGLFNGMAYDAQRQLLYVAYIDFKTPSIGIIYAFDARGSIVAFYRIINGGCVTGFHVQNNGTLVIGVSSGYIGVDPIGSRIIRLRPLQR